MNDEEWEKRLIEAKTFENNRKVIIEQFEQLMQEDPHNKKFYYAEGNRLISDLRMAYLKADPNDIVLDY